MANCWECDGTGHDVKLEDDSIRVKHCEYCNGLGHRPPHEDETWLDK